MDEEKLSAGDTVYLRPSSEPLMTVAETSGDDHKCVWFGTGHKIRTHVFDTAMLDARAPGLTIVINTGDGKQDQNVDGGNE